MEAAVAVIIRRDVFRVIVDVLLESAIIRSLRSPGPGPSYFTATIPVIHLSTDFFFTHASVVGSDAYAGVVG